VLELNLSAQFKPWGIRISPKYLPFAADFWCLMRSFVEWVNAPTYLDLQTNYLDLARRGRSWNEWMLRPMTSFHLILLIRLIDISYLKGEVDERATSANHQVGISRQQQNNWLSTNLLSIFILISDVIKLMSGVQKHHSTQINSNFITRQRWLTGVIRPWLPTNQQTSTSVVFVKG